MPRAARTLFAANASYCSLQSVWRISVHGFGAESLVCGAGSCARCGRCLQSLIAAPALTHLPRRLDLHMAMRSQYYQFFLCQTRCGIQTSPAQLLHQLPRFPLGYALSSRGMQHIDDHGLGGVLRVHSEPRRYVADARCGRCLQSNIAAP